MVRAQSMGEAKMKRDSSTFRKMTETADFFLEKLRGSPESLDSSSLLVVLAGSGICARSKVSGTKKIMSVANDKMPIPMLIGTNELDFMRYHASGTATTVAIRYVAVPWKNNFALRTTLALFLT